MKKPNFIICGAAKSGTTVLYKYLRQHPAVFMSVPKEPRYFAFRGRRPDYRGPGDEIRFNATTIYEKNAYYSLFDEANSSQIMGEASPIYLFAPGCAREIHDELPDVKLIFILRHPVERAYSAYLHQVRAYCEELPFWNALQAEAKRASDHWAPHWQYGNLGYSGERIGEFLELFPKNQVLFIKYDDFKRDNFKTLKDVCRFIGVDSTLIFEQTTANVDVGRHKSKIVAKLLSPENWLRNAAGKIVPPHIRKVIGATLRKVSLRKMEKPNDLMDRLLPLYASDIQLCEKLTGLDLKDWMSARPRYGDVF